MRTGVTTIVVAGGGGDRFGGAKQFATLRGATVLDRAVLTAVQCSERVVVVLPEGVAWSPPAATVVVVTGGATRSASTRAGLGAVDDGAEIVVVHDAARPLASPHLYAAVVAAVRAGADAAVPAIAVSDTLKRVDGDLVIGTVARDGLVAVQTPQAFAAAVLRRAHGDARDDTDDAALVEAMGGRVVVVPGEARNLKITVAADLENAAALLEAP